MVITWNYDFFFLQLFVFSCFILKECTNTYRHVFHRDICHLIMVKHVSPFFVLKDFSSFIVWNCNSLWSVNKMETKMYKFRVNWNDYTVRSPCMSYNEPCKKIYCVCVCFCERHKKGCVLVTFIKIYYFCVSLCLCVRCFFFAVLITEKIFFLYWKTSLKLDPLQIL